MTRNNLILLIIIGVTVIAVIFGFLYWSPKTDNMATSSGTSQGTNFVAQFLPFGNTKKIPKDLTPPADVSGFVPAQQAEQPMQKLMKVSSFPIAGFGIFVKERFKEVPIVTPVADNENIEVSKTPLKPTSPPTEFAPFLRYVERGTGNIYQTFADKITERKLTTTIIPQVYEAYFGNNGDSVIMRYLKEGTNKIQTFTGILPKDVLAGDSISTTEIKGSFLPEDISDMSILPNASKIFYLFDIGDGSAGITAGPLGESKFQMFSSPFTEWLSQYPNIKTITVTTKPASTVPGYMYAIDTSKKDLKKVMGNINGLTTLMSPDSKMVLYSKSEAGNISLGIYHLDTGDFDILGVKTLPEKCVWGKNSDVVYCSVPRFINQAEYPDAWYQGEISFSDTLWKINPQTENATVIADPAQYQAGADIDGIKLGLNEAENYLFFINKKDSYLWELALK